MDIFKQLAKTPISLKITDGLDENGSPKVVQEVEAKARVESTSTVVYTKDGQKVTLSKKAFIFDNLETFQNPIEGICLVEGKEHKVVTSAFLTNPDGSLNHIKLGLA